MSPRPALRPHFPVFLFRSHKPPLSRIPRRFESSTSHTRINQVLDRLPRFLRPYTNGLRNAPVTHVASFLILHEITAVLPLFGLAGLFHWTGWIPDVLAEGSAVSEGVQKFGRYFARKGWFGFDRTSSADTSATQDIEENEKGMTAAKRVEDVQEKGWIVGEGGSRILVEVATAYAITKVLLPARILLSVWATPWFARNVLGRLGKMFGGGQVKGSAAARTGASAGTVGKVVKKTREIP